MILEVNDLSVRYMVGDFKDIGFKDFVVRKVAGNYDAKEFWAIKSVSFSLDNGDFLGIIGTNGAGKSTLLKAITGIVEPQKGTCKVNGTIAALLELGTGFDKDMTLRENIFLRGALLGYSEEFIKEMSDSILEFAELKHVENYKYSQLSSGMRARLAFSISCLVNPDLLILDEVLSVGDASFHKKSEKKMMEIINSGTTTILVSHSLAQVRRLCNKVLWLDHGRQVAFGEAQSICDEYEYFLKYGTFRSIEILPETMDGSFKIPFVPQKEDAVLALSRDAMPEADEESQSQSHFDVGFVAYMSNNYGSIATNYALYKSLQFMNLSVILLNNVVPIRGIIANKFAQDNMYLGTSQDFGFKDEEMNNYFDSFIIGSDQIWHPYTPFCKENMGRFHLEFANSSKRAVAYGASYGVEKMNLPDLIRVQYTLWKQRFDAIGFRESYAVNETKTYFGVNSELVIDPVFLCPKKNYEDIILDSHYNETTPYILVYILECTDDKLTFLNFVAKTMKRKLVIVLDLSINRGEISKWSTFDNVRENLEISDWLYYIKNCDYMITDSFYASCFALIFNKQFIAVKKDDDRCFETLELQTGLKFPVMEELSQNMDSYKFYGRIDYSEVQMKLDLHIRHGYEFLERALKEPRSEEKENLCASAYNASKQLQLVLKHSKDLNDMVKDIGYLKQEREEVCMAANEGQTYLEALQQAYDIKPAGILPENCQTSDIKEYFSQLDLSDNIIFICAKDTANKYIKKFVNESGLPLKNLPGFRDSYLAILENGKVLLDRKSNKKQRYSYNIIIHPTSMNISNSPDNTNFQIGITIDPEKFKSILLKSRGFDPITQTSNANIFINNIDYSCNHIGLNIVVYSKSQNAVIDTFYVDTFCDPKTERNARI